MRISSEAERAIKAEIRDDEKLLWEGQPNPSRMMLSTFGIYVFAVPWTAFSVFWMYGASGLGHRPLIHAEDYLFALFGLPFVLFGIGLLFSPYFCYRKALSTVYAVTDKRALIITGHSSKTVESFYANDFSQIDRRERADGSGDVIFSRYYSGSGNNATVKGFFSIEKPRELEDLIRTNLIKSQTQPPRPTTSMYFKQ